MKRSEKIYRKIGRRKKERKKERKIKYRKRERKQTNWQTKTQTKEREKLSTSTKWMYFIQNHNEFENVTQIPSINLSSFSE